jgi:hypothetical protein
MVWHHDAYLGFLKSMRLLWVQTYSKPTSGKASISSGWLAIPYGYILKIKEKLKMEMLLRRETGYSL